MKIAKIINNDIVNGTGINTTLFVQGCPHHCLGCFNPETWDPAGGRTVNNVDLLNILCDALNENGVKRNLSILGGEPLAPYNIQDVSFIVTAVKELYPDVRITIWTGYTFEELKDNTCFQTILQSIDTLIDGPFVESEKDLSLRLRGSRNQRILTKGVDF